MYMFITATLAEKTIKEFILLKTFLMIIIFVDEERKQIR